MPKTNVLTCPNCGASMQLEYQEGDKLARCPYCQTMVDLPERHQPPPTFQQQARPMSFPAQPYTGQGVPRSQNKGCTVGVLISAIMVLTLGVFGVVFFVLSESEQQIQNTFNNISTEINVNVDISGPDVPVIVAARSQAGQDSLIERVIYSPNGRMVAVDGMQYVTILDAASGNQIAQLSAPGLVSDPYFSADSTQIIAMNGSSIVIYDVGTGQQQRSFGRYRRMGVLPGGEQAVVVTYDEQVQLIDIESGQTVQTLVDDLGFSPQEVVIAPRYVALLDTDAYAIYEVESGARLLYREERLDALAFSNDGQSLAYVDSEERLHLYTLQSGEFVEDKVSSRLRASRGLFGTETIAFSPDASEIVVGNFFGGAIIWDIAAGEVVAELENDRTLRALDYSPDGQFIVAGTGDSRLAFYPRQGGSLLPGDDTTICTVTVNNANVNIRRGASTDTETVGQREAGETLSIDAQVRGSDGFTWWRLTGGLGWVREDVVTPSQTCERVQVVD